MIRSSGSYFKQFNKTISTSPIFDYEDILKNIDTHSKIAKLRNHDIDLKSFPDLYFTVKRLRREENKLNNFHNIESEKFKTNGFNSLQLTHLKATKIKLADIVSKRKQHEVLLEDLTFHIPNFIDHKVPIGNYEQFKICSSWNFSNKRPKVQEILDHSHLGKSLNIFDMERGNKCSGSGFFYLTDQGALLENALVNFVLKSALAQNWKFVSCPDVVKRNILDGCGFIPRDKNVDEQIFTINQQNSNQLQKDQKVLSGTSELALAALRSNEIINSKELPLKFIALSHCFRPETGNYGKNSRGLFRVKQFTKLELFIIKDNDNKSSSKALEEILEFQKNIYQSLFLDGRVLLMPSEELGASAAIKYDLETFFPSLNKWGEICSSSFCGDYQSRRLNIRYRSQNEKKMKFCHTLNGTAIAIPRIIQAIIENFQTVEGSIMIPEVLRPFMLDGSSFIAKK